jgi:hypothetical protein
VLDCLTTGLLMETPGPLAEGGWAFGIYLDEKGSSEARGALEKISRGQAGGPLVGFPL